MMQGAGPILPWYRRFAEGFSASPGSEVQHNNVPYNAGRILGEWTADPYRKLMSAMNMVQADPTTEEGQALRNQAYSDVPGALAQIGIINSVVPGRPAGSLGSLVGEKTYKGALGDYTPRASITKTGEKIYFSTTSTDKDLESLRSNPFKSFEDAVKEAEKYGFKVASTSKDGFGNDFINLIHEPTKNAENEFFKAYNSNKDGQPRIFVRYGDIPEGGRSYNYLDNRFEDGTSVFYGYRGKDGKLYAEPVTNNELGTFLFMNNRPLYEVTGDHIGFGSDGEPILKNAKIVGK